MPAVSTEIILTEEQRAAAERLLSFPEDLQTLGGFAGTGKTTIIKELAKRLPWAAVCAFTGKAVNVLRKKGLGHASTIHSLIYDTRKGPDGKLYHELKYDLGGVQQLIVDEASMINQELFDDLASFGLPMIFVGDHGQLPPVGGFDFNLMKSPQVVLEHIHRNAGEVAWFANYLRQGNNPSDWQYVRVHQGFPRAGGPIHFLQLADLDRYNLDWTSESRQIICAINKDRVEINKTIRSLLGKSDQPEVGDRIICLRNNKSANVFNGMQGVLQSIDPRQDQLSFLSNGYVYFVNYSDVAWNNPSFSQEDEPSRFYVPFDYAYAVTCHKAQGDEWDDVLVLEREAYMWEASRWNYTAASRAKRRVFWVPK